MITSALRRVTLLQRGLTHADRIFTHTSAAEKDMLFRLAREKAGGTGVEIGSAFGASSCFIAAGLRPGGGRLYCVDKWNVEYRQEGEKVTNYLYREDGKLLSYVWNAAEQKGDFTEVGQANGDCPTYRDFLSNTRAFAEVIRPLRKDSVEAAADVSEPVDLLFIDGWHEYQGVKRDWEAWFPKVKRGGTVVLHDYGWAEGVKRVVTEDVMPRTNNHGSLPNMFWGSLR